MAVSDLKTKARDAFRRRQYDLAVEMYLEALRFDANDPETLDGFFTAATKAREMKGKAIFGGMFSKVSMGTSRDPQKRMQTCFRGLAKKPEDKGLLLALGQAAGDANAGETAVAAYKRATAIDPDDAEAWKRLGQFHGHGGRIKEALAALDEAVRLSPRDQESVKLRKNLAAEGALQAGRYDKAGSSRELLKDQDEARRLETEDRRQLTEEHAASEVDEVQLRINDNPDDSRLWLRLADLHLHQNHEKRALEAMEKAASLDSENYELKVRVGDMKLRRLQALAAEAKEASEAAPDDAGLKEAQQAATLSFLQAQRKEYAKRVDAHPLDLKERFRLGRTLLALSEVDAAAAEFQQTVRDPKRKSESLLLLAQCFEKKNLTGLAIKKLEEAIQDFPALTSPQSKDAYYTYAALLERVGQREEARKVFEQIFEVDITYRDVSQRLDALTQG